MKAAIVVMSDAKSGTEEALGRLFNALATAYDFKQNGDEVSLLFQGAGTRWCGEIYKEEHPANALYQAVEDKVLGVSRACADVFGARDDAEKHGVALLGDNVIPSVGGLPSLRTLIDNGYRVITF